jgi:hypothetical protein
MTWLCKMANSVINKKGKLLEYRHLIANPKMRPTWTHSYGNELGRLAQGMPSRAKGMDTIFFIPRHKVPKKRTKDITYGLITCSIRPKKVDKPNRKRLVAGGDRVHYPLTRAHPPPTYFHQAANKQRNLNPWGKILHDGHQKILSMHPHGSV